MRWAFSAVVALAACYSPTFSGGAPCDPAQDTCPNGQTCVASGGGTGVCMQNGHTGVDAGQDAMLPDGSVCLGGHLLGAVCLQSAPTAAVSITAPRTVTTTNTTSGNCSEMLAQPSGPAVCVITGTTIDIPAGGTLRAIGASPLVLYATRTITIGGTVDVATHKGETIGGIQVLGAGARTAADCAAIGIDGQQGRVVNNNFDGGGGAAGGSFGGAGAAGGLGGGGDIARGNPVTAAPPTALIGGCPGGHGGNGIGDTGGGGDGGGGGGAVYLIAGTAITIATTGRINASGSGGEEGVDGFDSSGGGGGGGAGGMIGLEAPAITNMGTVFANGGGGGGGGGSQPENHGVAGNDPSAAGTTAAGGNGGSGGGGGGGNGAFGTTAPTAGKNATNIDECAGGGGGGGAGVIRVHGPAPGGTISPPATN